MYQISQNALTCLSLRPRQENPYSHVEAVRCPGQKQRSSAVLLRYLQWFSSINKLSWHLALPPPRIQWPIVKKVRADLSFHTREPQPHYFELISGFGQRKIEESDMLHEAAGFNVRGAWRIMFIRRQSVSFTKWRQRCLPFARPWPEAATRPSLNNFHDPAIFSHVVQMWCQSPSFADTEVRLKRGRDCK